MNKFKSLSKKDKAEYIAIVALYPFFKLFSWLGKSLKLFGTKKRQITASVLTFALIMTMLPTMSFTAFAATPTTEVYVGSVVMNATNQYAKTDADGKVTLGGSESDYNVKFDSTTGTLTLKNAIINESFVQGSYKSVIHCASDLKLILTDGTVNTITESNTEKERFSIAIYVGLSLAISGGGMLTVTGGETNGNSIGIASNSTLTIDGGTIIATAGDAQSYSYGILSQNEDIVINGGTVVGVGGNANRNASYGIDSLSKSIIINGGTVTGTGGKASISVGIISEGKVSITINGGTVTANSTSTTGTITAMNMAPDLSAYTPPVPTVTASTDTNGSSPVSYNASDIATYKYLKIEPSTYTVVGNGDMFGGDWDATNDSNNMVYDATLGKYVKVFDNIKQGDYEFKITLNNSWVTSWGDSSRPTGSAVAKVTKDGMSVKIIFDPTSEEIDTEIYMPDTAAHPTSWSELQTAINAGGEIKLTQDIVAESTDAQLNVPRTSTVTIDLNGYKIDRNLTTAVDNGSVFYINGGNLTINDTSTTDVSKQGKITGGSDLGSAGGVYMDINGSTFTMNGGNIVGNRATSTYASGGGVYAGGVACKFTMNGGSITGNTASYQGGGVYSYSWFSVSGNATIKDNTLSGGKVDNVCLGKKGLINVLGALSGEIGINTELTNYPVTVAQASTDPAYTLTASDVAKLTSDVDGYEAVLSGDVAVLQKQALYTVAGDAGLTGVAWNPAKNSMTHGEYTFDNSAYDYAITFADVAASTYSFKVTDGTMSNAWGDNGSNYTFNLTDTCPVTIYFNSDTKKIAVGAQYLDHFTLYAITAVGNGDGTWLNGVAWDVTDPSNDMTEIEPGVFQITYKDIAASTNYQVKFMANHAWTYYWTSDEIFKGDANPKIIVARDGSTITLTIDVNGFDFEKSTGSVKVDVKVTPPEPLTLSADNFTYTAPTDLTYNGTAKSATVTAKDGVSCGAITVKYYQGTTPVESPTDAGAYTVTIDVAANDYYKAATDLEFGTFTITAKALTKNDLTVTDLNDEIYTGSAIKPEPTVKYGDVTLVKDTDYTLSYGTNTAIGRGSVTINLNGNYSGSAQYEFDIAYGTANTDMYIIDEPNQNGWYNNNITLSSRPERRYYISKTPTDFDTVITLDIETDNGSQDFYVKDAYGKIYKGNFTYKLDKTAPTDVKIQYNNSGFKSFLNTITFGLFFNETVNVEATASDASSGIDMIQYYAADSEITNTFTITGWQNSLSLTQNSKKIVYIKVTDKAGNVTITNNEGVVVYTDSTLSSTSADFDRDNQADITIPINFNGNTIAIVCYKLELKGGSLVENTEYTVTSSSIIIKKAAIAKYLENSGIDIIIYLNPMGIEVIRTENALAKLTFRINDATHYHSGTHHDRVESTCTADGNVEYWSCDCGQNFSDSTCTTPIANIVIEKLGHDFTEKIIDTAHLKSAATCTSPAIYYYDCSRCDEISTTETFTNGEPLGHNFSGAYAHDAEYHWHICTHDGCTAIDAKVKHTWDNGKITKPATTEEKGEKTFTCKLCGATKTEPIDMLPPSITEKTDKYVQGSDTEMTFKSNAALSDLESVSVDGKVLDEKDYDKQSGSTIITLKSAFLETLSVGKHTIDIKSTTGTASAEFTIEAKAAEPTNPTDTSKPGNTSSPQTGDNNNMILWIALLFVSGGVLGTLGLTKKRRKQSEK